MIPFVQSTISTYMIFSDKSWYRRRISIAQLDHKLAVFGFRVSVDHDISLVRKVRLYWTTQHNIIYYHNTQIWIKSQHMLFSMISHQIVKGTSLKQ
jgi:hypothetical protein